jgi:hypothetical protein
MKWFEAENDVNLTIPMPTLQIVFLVLAASVILLWLALAVRPSRKVELPNVIAVLRYGSFLRTVALILALAPPTIMVVLVWSLTWRSSSALAMAGTSLLVLSFLAGLLLIEVGTGQIVLAEEGITRFSFWTGWMTLKWSEVQRIRYSTVNRWFVVMGTAGTIRVSRHLAGTATFVETVQRKVASERYASAVEVFAGIKP